MSCRSEELQFQLISEQLLSFTSCCQSLPGVKDGIADSHCVAVDDDRILAHEFLLRGRMPPVQSIGDHPIAGILMGFRHGNRTVTIKIAPKLKTPCICLKESAAARPLPLWDA